MKKIVKLLGATAVVALSFGFAANSNAKELENTNVVSYTFEENQTDYLETSLFGKKSADGSIHISRDRDIEIYLF